MSSTISQPDEKHAFLHYNSALLFLCLSLFFASLLSAPADDEPLDPGWRLSLIPLFETPALTQEIPGSRSVHIAASRINTHGETEFATTQAAWQHALRIAKLKTKDWLANAHVEIRRDPDRVINRITITGDSPDLAALPLSPAFYLHFEPLLGDGFYVVIPDRNTIILYPRIAGGIPTAEIPRILELVFIAEHPVSKEVFRATAKGLIADGILED